MSVDKQMLKPGHVQVISVKTVGCGVLFGMPSAVVALGSQVVHYQDLFPGFRLMRPSDGLQCFIVLDQSVEAALVPIEPDDGKLYRMIFYVGGVSLERQYCITMFMSYEGYPDVRVVVCIPKNWEHTFQSVGNIGVIAIAPRGVKVLKQGFL